ncbi:MAG TPA: hypothetical protein VFA38_07415 [Nitrospirales bacterium]|nr:hypothetical protein [Nitrospirales bacterium]
MKGIMRSFAFALFLVGTLIGAWPAYAQQGASEAEGGGRITREQDEPIIHICPGCLSPVFTQGSKGSITPYGRVELDAIYSTRNTNPLDPSQFNGYATGAGSVNRNSTTLNPRYSVFGIRADRSDGMHTLKGVVEVDFYGQTDNAGNLPPRLRLANIAYGYKNTSLTVGMDWTPVMSLHPDLIDFSIMGYGGNLWQRLPQITLRHKFTERFEGLFTVMRFERGLSGCCGSTQIRTPTPTEGGGPTNNTAFNDPVLMPYVGTRWAYTGDNGMMLAASAAFRHYRSAPLGGVAGATFGGTLSTAPFAFNQDINSYLVGGELVFPITSRVKFSGEIAMGQGLGVEFFRFNQELNLATGKPIRSVMGWGQLSYAHSREYTFLAGAGFDNPFDRDLKGSVTVPNIQYLQNYRTYLTAIHPIWSDFHVGLEWQHLWTNWAVGNGQQKFEGDMWNMSFWYNF